MFNYKIGAIKDTLDSIYPGLSGVNNPIVLSKPLLGSIFWYDFGNANGSVQAGKRPCVVFYNFAENNQDISNVLPLTTSLKAIHLPVHVKIKANKLNGLQNDSMVLCEQIKAVRNDCLYNPLGILTYEEFYNVHKARKIQSPLPAEAEDEQRYIVHLKKYFDAIIPEIQRLKGVL